MLIVSASHGCFGPSGAERIRYDRTVLFIFPRIGLDFYRLAHVLHFAGKRVYTPYTSYGHSPMYALREAFNRLFDHGAADLGAVQPATHALGFLNDTSSVFGDACTSYFAC